MVAIQGSLTIDLVGRGPLTLRPSNYVATGGEGSVYKAGQTIIKLYTDTAKMRRDGMPEKIRMLSHVKHPYIVAPQGVVNNDRGEPIGFYMPYVEGEPLARVFTSAFWHRESFTTTNASQLVDRMRSVVQTAHDHKAILVDANELNWIAMCKTNTGPEPRAIDVDSWAIGKWHATVIMPSIRDWHARSFDERSDWFSFGVVSFQIYTGIHPYRGTLTGYKSGDLEGRMKANASVFSDGVGLNRAVRDFTHIPHPLLEWYKATFQKGERTLPPSPYDKGVGKIAQPAMVRRSVTKATGSLVFEKLFEKTNDAIVRVYPCGIVLTASGALIVISSKKEVAKGVPSDAEVVRVKDGWLVAYRTAGDFQYFFIDERTGQQISLPFQLLGTRIFRYENRLFLATEDELVELSLMIVGKPLLTIGKRTQILQPNATNWFDGAGVQKAFNATFMVLPFGDVACTTVRIPELDSVTVIAAKAGNRFVTAVGVDKTGTYYKYDFTFTADYASYTTERESVDSPELNVALLPKGVGAMIAEDGKLVIFVPTNRQVREVEDKLIATDMALAHIDDRVVYVKDGALWSVKMT